MAFFRTLLTATCSVLWLVPAAAQTVELDRQRCQDTAAEISIPACTAVIDSGTASSLDVSIAFRYRGIAYLGLRDAVRAQADEERASQLYPQELSPFLYHGLALYREGRLRAALQDFNVALARNDEFAEAFYARALVERDLGDRQNAAADFAAAVTQQPAVGHVMASLGFSP